MKSSLGDEARLEHIIAAINELEEYVLESDFKNFDQNSMMKYASIKQIEIIGEAANYISEETKICFPAVQWKQIIGLRHILVHEYFGIDTRLIWQIISADIPVLKQEAEKILEWLKAREKM